MIFDESEKYPDDGISVKQILKTFDLESREKRYGFTWVMDEKDDAPDILAEDLKKILAKAQSRKGKVVLLILNSQKEEAESIFNKLINHPVVVEKYEELLEIKTEFPDLGKIEIKDPSKPSKKVKHGKFKKRNKEWHRSTKLF